MISVSFVLYCLFFATLASAIHGVTIQNDVISLTFDVETSALSSLVDKTSGVDMVAPEDAAATALVPLWTIQLADPQGLISLKSSQRAISSHSIASTQRQQTLSLFWSDVSLYDEAMSSSTAYVNVTLEVVLPADSAFSSWSLHIQTLERSRSPIGVWDAIISVPLSVGGESNGELFFPSGYGETFSNPLETTGGSVSGHYPSGGVSMQFMALADTSASASVSTSGVYVATHESSGSIKGFEYATLAYSLSDPVMPPSLPGTVKKVIREIDLPSSLQRRRQPLHTQTQTQRERQRQRQRQMQGVENTENSKLSLLKITLFAEDAGKELAPGDSWSALPVTVGLVTNISAAAGRPLWSEAALIYRDWVLHNAPWTAKTLAQRDNLPDWYRSNSLWINTHWQCHDVFNVTGGEPAVVRDMVSQIASLFDLPTMALHYYEWQQGPDPSPPARYKFDTHYPDYFPPRQPDVFKNTLKELRSEHNVYTIPYINGRIFDVKSDTYLADNGGQYCSQYVITPKLRSLSPEENRANLSPYVETYGSDATFCVASPFTPYWQESLTNTVAELTNTWEVDGVYIDQIGAADPKECYDPIHGHTLGGGTYWTEGYEQMLSSIQAAMYPRSDKTLPPIVTENNAEVYMDLLQGYLTLTAFKKSLAQSPSPGKITTYPHLSPAFPMVYGGYFIGFGAEWFLTDLSDPDWFCGKLSAMLTSGAQMGWFSLISIVGDPTDSCGDMGIGAGLLDPVNKDIVAFVRMLSTERVKVVDYLVDGHLGRPVVLQPPAEVLTQTVGSKNKPLLDYDQVSTAAWQLDGGLEGGREGRSTMIMLTGNTQDVAYSGEILVDFSTFGYEQETTLSLVVLSDTVAASARGASATANATADSVIGGTRASTLHGPVASIAVHVRPRSVVLLELKPVV